MVVSTGSSMKYTRPRWGWSSTLGHPRQVDVKAPIEHLFDDREQDRGGVEVHAHRVELLDRGQVGVLVGPDEVAELDLLADPAVDRGEIRQ